MAFSQEQSKLAIRQLAKSLANNYACSHVFGDEPEKKSLRRSLLAKESLIENYDRRLIVIVGSGASQDAGLVGTEDFYSDLRRDARFPLSNEVIDKELERLSLVQRLDTKQFETRLLAMSVAEKSSEAVRSALRDKYNRRFLPTLTYEILAHFLKHKFVDAIISFNFDELLDQAISDELKPEEYYHVLSDGDCPSDPLPLDKALKKPFYIKPHGTISHESTLRFTRDDYYRLPQGIQKLINDLIAPRPVDVVAIGFDMKSFEFISIVNNARKDKPKSNIFYINTNEVVPEPTLEGFDERRWIGVPDPKGLGVVMQNILDQTHKHLNERYPPRGIDRHQAIADLFEGEKGRDKDSSEYLWDRTVIEVALAVAKAKGFITMSVLSSGRPGKYFEEYKRKVTTPKKPFRKLCEDIGLTDIAYGFDALRLSKDPKPKILSWDQFTANLGDLISKVETELTNDRKSVFRKNKLFFKETLEMHYKGAEVELRSPPDILHDNLFLNPVPITSKRALDCQTEAMFENLDWTYVVLVSETGEWLLHDRIIDTIKNDPNRMIYLIVADDTHAYDTHADDPDKKGLTGTYSNQIKIAVMNWWDHNRHLTLFLDKREKPLGSIYFTRPRRATDIVPVKLDDIDSEIIHEVGKAYWLRAKNPKPIDRDMINKFDFSQLKQKAEA